MSIDPSTIKPGGKVSVTLKDGTKIIDSPVTERDGKLWIANGLVGLLLLGGPRRLDPQAVIDAYTPPRPEWDRDEVFAVKDKRGGVWRRDATGVWATAPDDIEDTYGPCTVLAVYAKSDQ